MEKETASSFIKKVNDLSPKTPVLTKSYFIWCFSDHFICHKLNRFMQIVLTYCGKPFYCEIIFVDLKTKMPHNGEKDMCLND